MQTVITIKECYHGLIGIAKDYLSAIDFLVNKNWLDGKFKIWVNELDEIYSNPLR
mgnify:CR=1 FL=1